MIIALDYDETFTADKLLWTAFVHHAKQRGHSVVFVTFRHGPHNPWREDDNEDIQTDAKMLEIDIVFSCHKQKREVFPQANIWIDDMPELIPTQEQLDMIPYALIQKATEEDG